MPALALHDLIRWNEVLVGVIDVAPVAPHQEQVVLHWPDRDALPTSLPLGDLAGAKVKRLVGILP